MAKRNERVERLERALVKQQPREVRILSSLDPDFKQQCAEAEAAGAEMIILVPMEVRHENH